MKPHPQTTSKQPSTLILNGPSTLIFNKIDSNASLAEILLTTPKVETTTTKPQLAIDLGKMPILLSLVFFRTYCPIYCRDAILSTFILKMCKNSSYLLEPIIMVSRLLIILSSVTEFLQW